MKFERFDYLMTNCPFFILPTIIIVKDNALLMRKNISIELGWLCFHCRWRWIENTNQLERL